MTIPLLNHILSLKRCREVTYITRPDSALSGSLCWLSDDVLLVGWDQAMLPLVCPFLRHRIMDFPPCDTAFNDQCCEDL